MSAVVAIWRYPLKSARGERVAGTGVDVDGLAGDRSWACLDLGDGTVASAKHPRRWQRLLRVRAHLPDPADPGVMAVRLAGAAFVAGRTEADAALSGYLGRPVRLTRAVPQDPRLHRLLPDEPGLVPQWLATASPGQELVTAIGGTAGGRFLDFGAVHLVTTGALRRLGEQLGGASVPAARFRPNLVLDLPADPEPGQYLRVGQVGLRVTVPTPRCVVPGLAQPGLPADRALLGALARHHRVAVPGFGRAACFGVYAQVLRPGPVRTGDPVRIG